MTSPSGRPSSGRRSYAGRNMRLLTVYDCIANDHDLRLVALAAAVCAVSSFAATNFLQNMQSSNAKRRALSLPFSALSTGLGIWATHFIAMLAFSIRIPNGYDISLTLFSLLAAITFTYAGFIVALRWREFDWAGGAIVGCGIAAMHYLGMAAFEIQGRLSWDATLVGFSIAMGMVGAAIALPIALRCTTSRLKHLGALLLVVSICCLHFTAMAAVSITADPTVEFSGLAIQSEWLAIPVALAGLIIVLLAVSAAVYQANRAHLTLIVCAGLIVILAAGTNFIILHNLRDNSLRSAESNLMRHTLVLGEQTDRSFKSLDLALSSIGDYMAHNGVNDDESYRRVASSSQTFMFLKDKITGLPHVDAVSLIDAEGKVIGFSRSWPAPGTSVADLDFFKSLSASSDIESFIGQPVQGRLSGRQLIFLARRVSDPNGEFLGVIVGAIARQYIENFLAATSLGEESAVSLLRNDGMLLARFPFDSAEGRADTAIDRTMAAGGILREPNALQRMTIHSARKLPS